MQVITETAIQRRKYWIEEIRKISVNFGNNSERLEKELSNEIKDKGTDALIDHLRLCGNMPESYGLNTTEEKQYSKYTDALLCETYKSLGFNSSVLKGRSDNGDVEAFTEDYDFVADAKAFRLSRTAKNQKDFKIQTMDKWKYGKQFAMVVCPIYHLPKKASQIYEQASSRNVCIFTYSHLAMLVSYSILDGKQKAEELIHKVFEVIPALNPSKNASQYWLAVNQTMLNFSKEIDGLWKLEKQAAVESIVAAKEEALTFLAEERKKIMCMSRAEAIRELIDNKIESRIRVINSVSDNGLLDIR